VIAAEDGRNRLAAALIDGEELRDLPLADRKRRLAKLLVRRRLGIVLSEHTDEDGAKVFRQACKMNLDGIVSKRLNTPYASSGSKARSKAVALKEFTISACYC
jgi:bifunctional non-homologous end joining protein LigD